MGNNYKENENNYAPNNVKPGKVLGEKRQGKAEDGDNYSGVFIRFFRTQGCFLISFHYNPS